MSETTTIEIYQSQKADLDNLKVTDSESYKDVLQRLIEHYDGVPGLTESEVREIVRDLVVLEALE